MTYAVPVNTVRSRPSLNATRNIVDPDWELIDPIPDIHNLFRSFNCKFFEGKLACVELEWSKRMTQCAGICYSRRSRGAMSCIIRLSEPLLKLRSRKELIETLLHEMIHAFNFVRGILEENGGHGANFLAKMREINGIAGTNITVYHSFHDEVELYRTHWWRCNGICQNNKPYFGYVKRTCNRKPGPNDFWWAQHQATCGGQFIKVKEPEKPAKKAKEPSKKAAKDPAKKSKELVKKKKEPSKKPKKVPAVEPKETILPFVRPVLTPTRPIPNPNRISPFQIPDPKPYFFDMSSIHANSSDSDLDSPREMGPISAFPSLKRPILPAPSTSKEPSLPGTSKLKSADYKSPETPETMFESPPANQTGIKLGGSGSGRSRLLDMFDVKKEEIKTESFEVSREKKPKLEIKRESNAFMHKSMKVELMDEFDEDDDIILIDDEYDDHKEGIFVDERNVKPELKEESKETCCCPICNIKICISQINSHLDECLTMQVLPEFT